MLEVKALVREFPFKIPKGKAHFLKNPSSPKLPNPTPRSLTVQDKAWSRLAFINTV